MVSPYCQCHKAILGPVVRANHLYWAGARPQAHEDPMQKYLVVSLTTAGGELSRGCVCVCVCEECNGLGEGQSRGWDQLWPSPLDPVLCVGPGSPTWRLSNFTLTTPPLWAAHAPPVRMIFYKGKDAQGSMESKGKDYKGSMPKISRLQELEIIHSPAPNLPSFCVGF